MFCEKYIRNVNGQTEHEDVKKPIREGHKRDRGVQNVQEGGFPLLYNSIIFLFYK